MHRFDTGLLATGILATGTLAYWRLAYWQLTTAIFSITALKVMAQKKRLYH